MNEYLEGLRAEQQGNYPSAEAYYRSALAVDPGNPEVMIHLFKVLFYQPTKFAPTSLYRKAVRLGAGNTDVLLNAARIQFRHNNVPNAMRFAKRALKLEPTSTEALSVLAMGYLKRRYKRQTRQTLDQALAINPDCPFALDVQWKFNDYYHPKLNAQVNAPKMVADNPESAAAHAAMAKAQMQAGDVEQGNWHNREALRLNPNSQTARTNYLEGLKQRNPVYNWAYRHGLSKLRLSARWFAFVWVLCALALIHQPFQGLGGLVVAAAMLPLILFVAVVILPVPISNIVFQLRDPVGRRALSPLAKAEMAFTALMIAWGLFTAIMWRVTGMPNYSVGVLVSGGCYVFQAITLTVQPRRQTLVALGSIWLVLGCFCVVI